MDTKFDGWALENDLKSKPLRDAAMKWLHDHDFGGCHEWVESKKMWHVDIDAVPYHLRVEVLEAGSRAYVWVRSIDTTTTPLGVAGTPRGLIRILNRTLSKKG